MWRSGVVGAGIPNRILFTALLEKESHGEVSSESLLVICASSIDDIYVALHNLESYARRLCSNPTFITSTSPSRSYTPLPSLFPLVLGIYGSCLPRSDRTNHWLENGNPWLPCRQPYRTWQNLGVEKWKNRLRAGTRWFEYY